jgi:hypothetical protein
VLSHSKNEQNGEYDSIIMETKHIERSDIVNSEKEDENEQIPNGGVKVILKDDGKIFSLVFFFFVSPLLLSFSSLLLVVGMSIYSLLFTVFPSSFKMTLIMNSVIVKMENERENGERKECENITDECENKEESDGESKNDHYNKSFVDNSKNKQNGESDSIIMENKHSSPVSFSIFLSMFSFSSSSFSKLFLAPLFLFSTRLMDFSFWSFLFWCLFRRNTYFER